MTNGRAKRREVRRPPAGVKIARIAGIPIFVAPSWLLSVIVIVVVAAPVMQRAVPDLSHGAGIAVAALLAVLLGASVLIHEIGHCLVARRCGLPVREVRLYLVGGVSELEHPPTLPAHEILIAGAGPVTSALLAGGCGALVTVAQPHTVTWLVLLELALTNGLVAAFNFLPALPLDGGRVLRAVVWALTGRRRPGTVAAAVGGIVVTAGLLIWAVWALAQATRLGIMLAVIAAVMAAFIGAGAIAEWPRRRQSDIAAASSATENASLHDVEKENDDDTA